MKCVGLNNRAKGVHLEEIMMLRLGGHIIAWYSEWRVLQGGGPTHFGVLGRAGVLEGAAFDDGRDRR